MKSRANLDAIGRRLQPHCMKCWRLGVLGGGWLLACSLDGCSSPHREFKGASGSGGSTATAGQAGATVPGGGRAPSAGRPSVDVTAAGEGGTDIGSGGMMGDAGAMPVTPSSCEPGTYACNDSCVPDGKVDSCGASCTACPTPAHGSPGCVGGTCTVQCSTGYHTCNQQCVDDTSILSCGTGCEPCTVPKGGSATCTNGVCGATCPSGKKLCLGACIDAGADCNGTCDSGSHSCNGLCLANSSTNSCGSLCAPCALPTGASSASCDGASCGFTCSSGYHRCGSVCAANNDATQCGSSCGNCPGATHGSAACTNNACALKCDSGYHACGSSCALNTSVQTCGSTSCTPCTAPANATATCDGTSCGFTCNTGWTGANCEYPRMQAVPMPTGYTSSRITGMSDDGSVAVGSIFDGSVTRAFRWVTSSSTLTTGLVSGQTNARASTVSRDGTRVHGMTDNVAFEWRLNQAPAQILNLPTNSTLARANSNGLIVAGIYNGGTAANKPLLYDFSNGTFSTPTSTTYASPGFYGISGDGLTAVGFGTRDSYSYPIRWTSAGFVELPGGPGIANAISANGQCAAGNVYVPGTPGQHAALWSGAGLQTFTDLGPLASLPNWRMYGKDVSQDGKVVVIYAEPPTGGDNTALIWTSSGGLQKLTDALGGAGIDVSAWDLKDATAVSANGKIIAGYGITGGVAAGFVARMP